MTELFDIEDKWRALITYAPNVIVIVNSAGKILSVNKTISGEPIESIIGRSIYEFADPASHNSMREIIGQVFKTGNTGKFLSKAEISGKIFWFDTQAGPVEHGGRVVAVTLVATDITERIQMEDALRKSEEKHRLIIQSMNDLIFVLDKENRFKEYYPSKEISLFLSPDEFEGKKLVDILPPEIINPYIELSKSVRETRKSEMFEYHLDLNEEERWFSASLHLHDDGQSIVAVIKDITKRKKAENQVEESEGRYQSLINSITDEVLETEVNGTISYVSPQVYDLLGYDPDKVIGTNALSYTHPDDLNAVAAAMKAAVELGEKTAVEFRLLHKQGHYVDVAGRGVFVERGGEMRHVAVLRDITQRKVAEEALKKSQTNLQTLFNSLDDLLFVLKLDGTIIDISPSVVKRLHYARDELIGKNILIIHPPDLREKAAATIMEIVEGRTDSCDISIFTKEKVEIPVETKVTRGQWGNSDVLFGISRDITERKKAEEVLRRLGSAVEQSIDGMAVADLEGYIQFVNSAWAQMHGYKVEELQNQHLSIFHTEKELEEVVNPFNEKVMKFGSNQGEVEHLKKDGSTFTTWMTTTLLKDGVRKPVGLIGIARDISERKKAEELLMQSEKKARHAYNRASFYKDLFAHDMNNILQNILGSAEIALLFLNNIEELGNAKLKLKKIQEQVERGADLVSNVQKLSMLDEVKSSFKPIDVLGTLNQVIMNVREGYSEKSLDIRVDSPEKPLLAIGNELLIDVFENLLANAIRHNENSEIVIEIKATQQEKDGQLYLQMEFKDNGVGIQDNRKDLIFERGYNGKRSLHGMGLGLSLVKQIISSYNGHIWVENRVPRDYTKGSNFILLIPGVK